MAAPLDGIRVIELTSWMAAPSAAAILADLGADVIKVEPPSGDALRGIARQPKLPEGAPKVDYPFQVDNRGKRSIAVALDQPAGAEVVRRLAADAHVFVCNLLTPRQQRFGLDPKSLFEVNPRLVHATLTGYGVEGPESWRPGYDVTAFWGRGGATEGMIEPGGVAPSTRPAQGDHTTGLALVGSILAALRLAESTGEGQVVDVSLFATAVWTIATDVSAALIDRREATKRDRRHMVGALVNRFRCGDDRWLVFNMPETHWWPKFCAAVEHPEWVDDERFLTPRNRFDNMPELVDLLDEALAQKPMREWGRIFDEAGLIWGPVQTLPEVVDDPQARAIGLFRTIEHPVAGPFETVANPLRIVGADIGPRGPAPEIGQHTRAVLAEAGYTPGEIDRLAADGVVVAGEAP